MVFQFSASWPRWFDLTSRRDQSRNRPRRGLPRQHRPDVRRTGCTTWRHRSHLGSCYATAKGHIAIGLHPGPSERRRMSASGLRVLPRRWQAECLLLRCGGANKSRRCHRRARPPELPMGRTDKSQGVDRSCFPPPCS